MTWRNKERKNALGKYFMAHHKSSKFVIRKYSGDTPGHTCAIFAAPHNHAMVFVQSYCRIADAQRAMKRLGLQREGRYWRLPLSEKNAAKHRKEVVQRAEDNLRSQGFDWNDLAELWRQE